MIAKRHAVVTGGSRGIGAAIAAVLSDGGCRVTVLGRGEAGLRAIVQSGAASGHVVADVSDGPAMAAALRLTAERDGPVDILVNNAGGASSAPFLDTPPDEFHRMLGLNLMGCVHAIHAVLPAMQDRGWGRVVTVASTAAVKGYAYVSAYAAAKHAALGLTRSLAIECARSGVTFNAVCPGFTESDMLEESVARIVRTSGRSAGQARAELARFNPQRRLIEPHEVAQAVLFLCGDGAAAVNGICLPVAGGEIM